MKYRNEIKTKAEAVKFLKSLGAHLRHTEKCVWENLNHGGECGCGYDAREYNRLRLASVEQKIAMVMTLLRKRN
jgi:hypothetical protein